MSTKLADPVEMIRHGAPRLIRSDEELAEYTRALFTLRAKPKPTAAELEAINLLAFLIEHYETAPYPAPKGSPTEVVRQLLKRNGLIQSSLTPEFGCTAVTSQVLQRRAPVHAQPHRSPQQALSRLPRRLLRRDIRDSPAPQHEKEIRAPGHGKPARRRKKRPRKRGRPMSKTLTDPAEMIRRGAPRLLRSDEELADYTRTLFNLTSKSKPTAAEQEAIDLLTLLIEQYETSRYPLPEARSVEVLRLLMERNGVSQGKITPELGFQASASLILLGKRHLNRGHIARLSRRFHVSPAVFFDERSAIALRRKVKKKKKSSSKRG